MFDCVSCCSAKSHRLPFQDVIHSFDKPLQLVHSNLWQSNILSNLGFKYYVCFVNDFSRYTWIYPLKRKSVHDRFLDFQTLVENLFECKIKYYQSDGGQNLIINHYLIIFRKCGIAFRKSCPDTQQQNGVAQRKHRHVIELARITLTESMLLGSIITAYIINRLSTPVFKGVSPFEKLFSKSPDYSFLRVFRCECFPNFVAKPSNKWTPRSMQCVFNVCLLGMLQVTSVIVVMKPSQVVSM